MTFSLGGDSRATKRGPRSILSGVPSARRLEGRKKQTNKRAFLNHSRFTIRFAGRRAIQRAPVEEDDKGKRKREREKPFGANVFHERNPIARAVSRIAGMARDTAAAAAAAEIPRESARFRSTPPRRVGSAPRIDRDAGV